MLLREFRALHHAIAEQDGEDSIYSLDPVQGLRRIQRGPVIEGVDVEEEALMYGVYLSDRVKYGGARQACTDESLSPKTIKSYVGTARKRLTMETGGNPEDVAVPGVDAEDDVRARPVRLHGTSATGAGKHNCAEQKISIGVRAAVLSSFRFTLRMGECASRLTTVFNSARALRLGDVSFTVDEHGKRTAVIFYTRGSKWTPPTQEACV